MQTAVVKTAAEAMARVEKPEVAAENMAVRGADRKEATAEMMEGAAEKEEETMEAATAAVGLMVAVAKVREAGATMGAVRKAVEEEAMKVAVLKVEMMAAEAKAEGAKMVATEDSVVEAKKVDQMAEKVEEGKMADEEESMAAGERTAVGGPHTTEVLTGWEEAKVEDTAVEMEVAYKARAAIGVSMVVTLVGRVEEGEGEGEVGWKF